MNQTDIIHDDQVLSAIQEAMIRLGNQCSFETLSTDVLVSLIRLMFKQHLRVPADEIVTVIRQFCDKCETELACRANELENQQVASICNSLGEYLQKMERQENEELKLVLLLNELRDNVLRNVKAYSVAEFLSIYCAYLQSMFFQMSANDQEKVKRLSEEFQELHQAFVDDLKLRRLNYLEPGDMVLLLKCYVGSQTVSGPALDFFAVCDKYLGKHSD